MSVIKNLCVYCGSSSNVADIYKESARSLGTSMAKSDIGLVYGGGHVGLMGIVADAVIDGGGTAVGIIPQFLAEKEVQHKRLTELHVVDSMHERKMLMAERADGYVVLPGGFGTLDEFFEILTWRQLNLHYKPIIIVNIDDYWTGLITLIDKIIDAGFAETAHRDAFIIVNSPDEVCEAALKWDHEIKELHKDLI